MLQGGRIRGARLRASNTSSSRELLATCIKFHNEISLLNSRVFEKGVLLLDDSGVSIRISGLNGDFPRRISLGRASVLFDAVKLIGVIDRHRTNRMQPVAEGAQEFAAGSVNVSAMRGKKNHRTRLPEQLVGATQCRVLRTFDVHLD